MKIGTSMIRTLDVRVTARRSMLVKMGRDDEPLAAGLFYVSRDGKRDHLATERAHFTPTPVSPEVLTYDEREHAPLFTNTDGHVVRTVDMGDATLPTLPRPVPVVVHPPKAKRGDGRTPEQKARKAARRDERAEHDDQILAFLRAKGYQGSLTADIRALALDAITWDAQVRAMAG